MYRNKTRSADGPKARLLGGSMVRKKRVGFVKENRSTIRDISFEITDDKLEAMNRRVMDRIYEESPWLVPGEHRRARVNPAARKYMSVWIAGFLAVFLCSFCF